MQGAMIQALGEGQCLLIKNVQQKHMVRSVKIQMSGPYHRPTETKVALVLDK